MKLTREVLTEKSNHLLGRFVRKYGLLHIFLIHEPPPDLGPHVHYENDFHYLVVYSDKRPFDKGQFDLEFSQYYTGIYAHFVCGESDFESSDDDDFYLD